MSEKRKKAETGSQAAAIEEMSRYRPELLVIARLQLRDDALAEDVVQETLLAAFNSISSFSGRSKLKTWLVGIMKYKILDALRGRARNPQSLTALELELDTTDLDALFDREGHWRAKPQEWRDPLDSTTQNDFMRVLVDCAGRLPPVTARVFLLRELMGFETAEICEAISITGNHLGVLLYRARISLRRCLEINWYREAGETS